MLCNSLCALPICYVVGAVHIQVVDIDVYEVARELAATQVSSSVTCSPGSDVRCVHLTAAEGAGIQADGLACRPGAQCIRPVVCSRCCDI